MLKRIRCLIIHPILFAVYPILFFYSYNISELRLQVLAIPLATSILGTLILWIIIHLFLKDIQKSALIVSFFVFLFYSFAHFYNFLGGASSDLGTTENLLIPYFGSFLIMVVLVKRMKKLRVATNLFTIFPAVLLVISASNIISFEMDKLGQQVPTYPIKESEGVQVKGSGQSQIKRDIYFIVLDAYARDDVLKEDYGYDNAPFLNFLKENGFYIASKSRANYAFTHISLTSTLNLTYFDNLISEFGTEKEIIDPLLYQMLHQNKAAEYLKSRGYTVINFDSNWGPTEKMQIADINTNKAKVLTFFEQPLDIDYFLSSFLQTTALSPFISETLLNSRRDKIKYNLERLAQVPYMKGNKFVIAHFLLPHPPAPFDENGNPIAEDGQGLYTDRAANYYLGALKFTNKKIRQVVEKILAHSDPEPIIIIESDHGPFLTEPDQGTETPSLTTASKKMSNLSAYYLPDGGDKLLYESITPVNTFRIIFNYYFGANYEILPDKVYYSWGNAAYKFYDFTNQIK